MPRAVFRVLVVDDEPSIRRNLSRALTQRGFSTAEAADGQSASVLLDASEAHFDLVVTDIRMPGMDGLQLAARIARKSPTTRILLMSGYTAAEDGSLPPHPFLAKPFTIEDFLARVVDLLDALTPPASFPALA